MSAHILEVKFCAFQLAHGGRLCDIVKTLGNHNFFGSAIAALVLILAALSVTFFGSQNIPELSRLLPVAFASQASTPLYRTLLSWLTLRYRSPDAILAP